uniref:Uncharacterized protein n=1 Tax=Yersinia enterocolitica TaxID=630 RepID=B0RKW1_YEREN|nr:hypothetical protein [Yersinia enterocolitica]
MFRLRNRAHIYVLLVSASLTVKFFKRHCMLCLPCFYTTAFRGGINKVDGSVSSVKRNNAK